MDKRKWATILCLDFLVPFICLIVSGQLVNLLLKLSPVHGDEERPHLVDGSAVGRRWACSCGGG